MHPLHYFLQHTWDNETSSRSQSWRAYLTQLMTASDLRQIPSVLNFKEKLHKTSPRTAWSHPQVKFQDHRAWVSMSISVEKKEGKDPFQKMVLSVIVYSNHPLATRSLPSLKERGRFLKYICVEEHLFVYMSYQKSSCTRKSPAEYMAWHWIFLGWHISEHLPKLAMFVFLNPEDGEHLDSTKKLNSNEVITSEGSKHNQFQLLLRTGYHALHALSAILLPFQFSAPFTLIFTY